jgi:thiosulfate/3-mercaptopyruvate sulfurtransferase
LARALRYWLLALAAIAAGIAPSAAQQTDPDSPLVTANWLRAHINEPQLRLIDIGKTPEQFAIGHLPGAQFVDWRVDIVDTTRPELFLAPQPEALESLLSRLGVDKRTRIVLYDNHGNRFAARMFWILRLYGHGDLKLLDGGQRAWLAAGGATTGAAADVAARAYAASPPADALRVDRRFILGRLADPALELVDARRQDFYSGESTGMPFGSDAHNEKAGHIAGARNFFWEDHVNADGRFRSAAELKAHYEALGVDPNATIVTYCHIGLQAATPWFVLKELLGYRDVRLYDGSMADWANADDTELVLGGN